jgi:WD40 repeat protein
MSTATKSLTAQVRILTFESEIVAVDFLGDVPTFACADGAIIFAPEGAEKRIAAHPDATMLIARGDGKRLVTGGDDGRVVATDRNGETTLLGDEKGKWIDALALGRDGAVAWSVTKDVRARDGKGEVKSFVAPSSARGLYFAPKGYRLAMAHYNGVSLWFPNTAGDPETFKWAGSHLEVTMSPDAKFVVSAMQENSLHGWRVADRKDMRMTGYPAKTRSLSWSHDGAWLSTSGAEACVIWPFQSKDGPMGKPPRECGVRPSRVSRVAFHPSALIVALGYEDGWVMLCRLGDAAEILVRSTEPVDAPGKGHAISALAWSHDGKRLAYGAEDGAAGVLQLPN